jgi:hypothetical protein
VKELANMRGTVTPRRVRLLRTFADDAGNTVLTSKETIQFNTSNIVL